MEGDRQEETQQRRQRERKGGDIDREVGAQGMREGPRGGGRHKDKKTEAQTDMRGTEM